MMNEIAFSRSLLKHRLLASRNGELFLRSNLNKKRCRVRGKERAKARERERKRNTQKSLKIFYFVEHFCELFAKKKPNVSAS